MFYATEHFLLITHTNSPAVSRIIITRESVFLYPGQALDFTVTTPEQIALGRAGDGGDNTPAIPAPAVLFNRLSMWGPELIFEADVMVWAKFG